MSVRTIPPSNIPTQPSVLAKRTIEEASEPSRKKRSAVDLEPLFYKILGTINSPLPAESLTEKEAIDLLSFDEDVIFQLQQVPIQRIKETFKVYLSDAPEILPHKKRIWRMLGELYPIALFNSAIKSQLIQTARELPNIQERVSQEGSQELHRLMREGRELRRNAHRCTSLEQAPVLIPQIESMLNKLDHFRQLKRYQDKDENQRILDLSKHLTRQGARERYPEIQTGLKPVVEKLKARSADLLSVSHLIQQLLSEKLRLQQLRVQQLPVSVEESPLETRFLRGFSNPLYNAFAGHFWTLLWNSKSDPEIGTIMTELPNADKEKPDEVSLGFLNEIWVRYLPDHDFEEWILKALAATEPKRLDELEKSLQEKTVAINRIHENPDIRRELKPQMESPHYIEMQHICTRATPPPFSSLAELRAFLKS
ncbi:MAG: hypothetical protein JSS60_04300 [Verrucomicrobia bacterium]|nr:hypothetical protein [Verrucomicrobiota bacterium]